jgi:hypothetical protein
LCIKTLFNIKTLPTNSLLIYIRQLVARRKTTTLHSHVFLPTILVSVCRSGHTAGGTLHIIEHEPRPPTQTSLSSPSPPKQAEINTKLESMGGGDEQPALQVIVLVSTVFLQCFRICHCAMALRMNIGRALRLRSSQSRPCMSFPFFGSMALSPQ